MSNPNQRTMLLGQLQHEGSPAALAEIGKLQKLYHDREMAGLATDAYASAKGEGEAPAGWIRASEHPELLARYAPALGTGAYELIRQFHPDSSGFRAEIYLPDPSVLGPGFKPVLAFKGSSGEVLTPSGLRDTSAEDFVANNFPQSVGLETDYYDRAMRLATTLKDRGLDFEITGHSLAGGMASAASAVTGMRATTYNAAGLHPVTAQRFAEQHGLAVYDVSHRITAYQVQGELLSNGVQDNIHAMDANQRRELGGVLRETCTLLQQLPEARQLLENRLMESIPSAERDTVRAFIGIVATGDTDKLLRELPLAAGEVPPLLAPMRRLDPNNPDSQLVARNQALSLPELTYFAGPVLEAANAAAHNANLGRQGGELIAAGGRVVHGGLDSVGGVLRSSVNRAGAVAQAATRAGGSALQEGERATGDVLAHGREASAALQAGFGEVVGHARDFGAEVDASLLRGVGRWLPDSARQWMDHQADRLDNLGDRARESAQATAQANLRDGHADAAAIRAQAERLAAATGEGATAIGTLQQQTLSGAGALAASSIEFGGRTVEDVTRRAPLAGAVWGGVPGAAPTLLGSVVLGQFGGKQATREAFDRHLMSATVLPSMDKRIENVEQEARQQLHQRALVPAAALRLDEPGHPGHAMFCQIRGHVHGIDASMGRTPDQRSDNLSGHLAVASHASGLDRVDTVALSEDGSRAFAVQERTPRVLSLLAQVDVSQALHTPLAQSSAAWLALRDLPAREPAPTPTVQADPTAERPLALSR